MKKHVLRVLRLLFLFVLIFTVSTLPNNYVAIEPMYPETDHILLGEGSVTVPSIGRDVVMRSGVYETLQHAYKNQDTEFPFCLHGSSVDNKVKVEALRVPDVTLSHDSFGSFNNVSCALSPDYLGMIHNHPTGACFPSSIDFGRFNESTYATLEVVACRKDSEVSFFGVVKPDPTKFTNNN